MARPVDLVFFWGLLALALVPLIRSVRRGRELFVVKIRNGRVRFLRGRLPTGLLRDIEHIAAAAPIEKARLIAIRRDGAAAWKWEGEVAPAQRQQLLNALALYSVARIAAGPKPKRPSR